MVLRSALLSHRGQQSPSKHHAQSVKMALTEDCIMCFLLHMLHLTRLLRLILDKNCETTEQFDAFTGSKCPLPPVSMLFKIATRRLSPTCMQESLLSNIFISRDFERFQEISISFIIENTVQQLETLLVS